MGANSQSANIEIYVAIKDGIHRYYLLKVERSGFDIYCFPHHLGVHYSLHESGVSHFRFEDKAAKPGEELPMALLMGEAGTPIGKGIMCASLRELGRASCICTAIFSIDSVGHDFRKFDRSVGECFVIDKDLLPKDTISVEVGVWAVPARNMASFEFNNPDISADLLFKVAQCDPQIWIYARPR
jgi:hypothetical protein